MLLTRSLFGCRRQILLLSPAFQLHRYAKGGMECFPWVQGRVCGGVDCSSLGSRRSFRRSGVLVLGPEEELKEEWNAPPWARGGALG